MQSTVDEPISAETIPVLEQLQQAVNALKSLRGALDDVRHASDGVPFAAEIGIALQPALSALSESERKLRNPTFSLAMVGTTSAGKSTLVNALIGSYLAPIDAGQLSAGIVTFRHSDRKLLKIDRAEKNLWESGEWHNFNDVECHDRLRDGVMDPYWGALGKNHDVPAPNVLIEASILPGNLPSLLGLPGGVGVEIIDLPGLNSTHDRRNLAVIQDRIHRSFSIVVMDYAQTNLQQRGRLLDEVRQTVHAMGGNTDTVLFVLNRVDQHDNLQFPLTRTLEALKQDIGERLGLQESPEIIPICAMLQFHAQCSWGPQDTSGDPDCDTHSRNKLLRALSKHFTGHLQELADTTTDPRVREWIEKHGRNLASMDQEALRQFLDLIASPQSGVETLWAALRGRVSAHFAKLIIAPAVTETIQNSYRALSTVVGAIELSRAGSIGGLEQTRQRLEGALKEAEATFRTRRDRFRDLLKAVEAAQQSSDFNLTNDLLAELGLDDVRMTAESIETELRDTIIRTIRRALRDGMGGVELTEELEKWLQPITVRRLCKQYEHLVQFGYGIYEAKHGLRIAEEQRNSAGQERCDKAIQICQSFYLRIREAMSERASVLLQASAHQVQETLRNALEKERVAFSAQLQDSHAEWKAFLNAVLPCEWIDEESVTLSPEVFSFLDLQKEVGVDKPSCFGSPKNVVALPAATDMANAWATGLTTGRDACCGVLLKWAADVFRSIAITQEEMFSSAAELLRNSIAATIQAHRQDHQEYLDRLSLIECMVGAARTQIDVLKQS